MNFNSILIGSEDPQQWEIGVKEVWEVPKPLDRVIHTMGWPLQIQLRYGKHLPTEPRSSSTNPLINSYEAGDGRWIVRWPVPGQASPLSADVVLSSGVPVFSPDYLGRITCVSRISQ